MPILVVIVWVVVIEPLVMVVVNVPAMKMF